MGKDVEDAVRLALHDLKAERDQVEVIVLKSHQRFFGIGSKLAKVRVQKSPKRFPAGINMKSKTMSRKN